MLRSRIVRLCFLAVIIFTALIATGIAVLPFLVSTDAIRLRLARNLSTWTGHNVQLHGAPHLSIFPSFQASLPGVTLTDADNSGAILMQAEKIEVDLSLYDALQGKVHFSETRIIHPTFNVEEPVQTVAGFFTSLSRSEGSLGIALREAQSLVQQNAEKPDTSKLQARPFGRIIIEDGSLTYPTGLADETGAISHINAVIDWPDFTRAAALKASGQWHGALTSLTISADQALLLMAGSAQALRASLNSNRGGITFTGTARFAQTVLLNGQIAARSPGVDTTLDWLSGTENYHYGITAPVVWQSSLAAQLGYVELNDIAFTFGKDSARGALETTMQDGRPVTSGSLAFETLELNQFLPALFANRKHLADFLFPDWLGLDLRLSTAQASLGKTVDISNLAASVQIRRDGLALDIGNAQLFGGAAQSTLQVRRGKKTGFVLESRLSASNINLEQLQTAFQRSPVLRGQAGGTLTLQSTFGPWAQMLPHAQGNASLSINSGSVPGFDINVLLQKLAAGETFPLTMTDKAEFPFDRAESKATLNKGQIKLDAARVSFGGHSVDINGNITIADKSLKLDGIIDPARLAGNLCADIVCLARSLQPAQQFKLDGSWKEPLVTPKKQ